MRNPDFHRALGKRIEALRREFEMTQAELARALGVSQQTVFAIECGTRRVHLDIVPRLLDVFGVTVAQLLGLQPMRPLPKTRVSPAEARHIERLRRLTQGDRRVVVRVTEALRRL
jgi:transcriptional regulator with XRE-family HTH domain